MDQAKKIGIDDLLKMSKADRNKAFSEGIKNGTVVIPSKKEDPVAAARWEKFYLKEPEEILKEESAQKPVADPVKETTPNPEEKPPVPTEKPAENKPAEPHKEDEPKKESRFKTVDEAEKELSEKEKLLGEQLGSVAKLNETVNLTAAELQRAKEENERLKKLISEKPAEKVEPINFPELPDEPELPDASDGEKYPEGIYDEGYKKDMTQYKQNVVAFKKVRKDRDALITESLKKANEALQEMNGLKTKVTEFEKFRETSEQKKIREETEKATSERDSIIDSMLKNIGVSFKEPWKKINDARVVLGNKEVSPEARKVAEAYLKSISKEDINSFESLVKAANVIFTKDGKPLYQNKPKMFRAALEEEGFTFKEENPKSNDVDLTKLKTETNASQGIPPDRMGSDDRMTDLTRNEKLERLKEIGKTVDEYQKRGQSCKKENPKLWQERTALMAELGISFG